MHVLYMSKKKKKMFYESWNKNGVTHLWINFKCFTVVDEKKKAYLADLRFLFLFSFSPPPPPPPLSFANTAALGIICIHVWALYWALALTGGVWL